jgi:hypothetical protein
VKRKKKRQQWKRAVDVKRSPDSLFVAERFYRNAAKLNFDGIIRLPEPNMTVTNLGMMPSACFSTYPFQGKCILSTVYK